MKWIDINDELPPHNSDTIIIALWVKGFVRTNNDSIEKATNIIRPLKYTNVGWLDLDDNYTYDDFSFWLELPKCPKE